MPQLILKLLGGFDVTLDDEPATGFESNKARALLAYLAVESDRSHRRDSLAALLWPGYPDTSARTNLRNALYCVRNAIGDRDADPPFLLTSRQALQFNTESDYRLDVAVLEDAIERADRAPLEQLRAADLYTGDFLAGFILEDAVGFDDWAAVTRERLRRDALELLGVLVDRLADEGDNDRALDYARRRVDLEPWLEDAQRQLIRLLAATGQRSAALRQYRRCVRVLEEELGAEPAMETRTLYEEIRATDTSVRQASGPKSDAPAAAPRDAPEEPAFLEDDARPATSESPAFMGREPELARLRGYLDGILAGEGRAAFIVGGPGTGKTALMRAFAKRAVDAHPDLRVVSGACTAHAGGGSAYLPFREMLGMLTGDLESAWRAGTLSGRQARRLWSALPETLPILIDQAPVLLSTLLHGPSVVNRAKNAGLEGASWMPELQALSEHSVVSTFQQSALFQQLSNALRSIAHTYPIVLMIDDLQWIDQESLSLLSHLEHQLAGARMLILGAYRPEEVAAAGSPSNADEAVPTIRLLNEAKRRFGDVWIDLERVEEEEAKTLVDAIVDVEVNCLGKSFRQRLYERTLGHPLFTVELLQSLRTRGDLTCDADGVWDEGESLDWGALPARVEAVIAERLSQLDRQQRDLLTTASVEGTTFTAQVIAHVTGRSERRIIETLSRELADRHRLVKEQGDERVDGNFVTQYEFTHVLYQEHLYQSLSPAEQRLLHGDVAAAIETLFTGHLDDFVTELAHHYERAGNTEKSIEYAMKAGHRARALYAGDEAIRWYERALESLSAATGIEQAKARQLTAHTELGKLTMNKGEIKAAERHFREAIALAEALERGPQAMTLLYHWLGETLIRQERYEERLQLGEEGLALLDDDRQSIGGALMNQAVAFAAWALGDWERARALTLKTASFIRDLPWTEELSIPYDHIGFVYALEKDMETSNAFKQAAIEKAKTVDGFHYLMAQLYSAEPMNHFFSGDLWGSIQTQRDHLKIARRVGRIDSQVWGLLRMAWRRFLLGDLKGTATQLVEIRPRLESAGRPGLAAMYTWIRGQIALCRGEPRTALRVLRDTASVTTVGRDITEYLLGRTHLALGQRGEALRAFEKGLRERVEHQDTVENPDYLLFPRTPRCLAGTEEAHERSAAFRAWYRQRPELIDPAMPIDPWSLVEADSPRHSRTARVPGTVTTAEWSWEDPFGDCSYRMDEDTLTLNAANGRHLWYVNVSAPRLLRPLPADVTAPVIQATCEPALDDRPAIGGLLLWHDDENYLWLDIGRFERRDVAFGGCLENRDRVIGRGLLPEGPAPGWAVGEPVTLRFEVTGDRVDALCSLDREQWFSVGHATFPVDKEAQVGVHAIGMIDRTIYHGAYPEGTAIRFTAFNLWGT